MRCGIFACLAPKLRCFLARLPCSCTACCLHLRRTCAVAVGYRPAARAGSSAAMRCSRDWKEGGLPKEGGKAIQNIQH